MCYFIITKTVNLVSKTLVEHVTIYDNLKPVTKSRIDEFNKKFTERLDHGNFQVNSDVDGMFHFVLPDNYFREKLSVDYASGVTPMDDEYNDMIVKG